MQPISQSITAESTPTGMAHLPALTWWLTGLPAAGKTTIARALQQHLMQRGEKIVVLDGDDVRQGLCVDLDFSSKSRVENIRRVAEVAKIFNSNGIGVVVALVSPFEEARQQARQIIGDTRFVEVYVSTPLDVCRQRDPKGLYAKALQTPEIKLTGLGGAYEPPHHADVVIDTSTQTLASILPTLIAAAEEKQKEFTHV